MTSSGSTAKTAGSICDGDGKANVSITSGPLRFWKLGCKFLCDDSFAGDFLGDFTGDFFGVLFFFVKFGDDFLRFKQRKELINIL